MTEIKNRKHGLQEFLNRDDQKMSIDIDKIRKHYVDSDNAKTLDQTPKMDMDDIDRYIANQKRKQAREPLKLRFKAWFDRQFLIQSGSKTIYVWRSRVFEEITYLYVPRFFFFITSSWVIYQITMKQKMNQRQMATVRSHRQEAIDEQLLEIEKVLSRDQNQFEPGKKIEYDKSYAGDQFQYLYQKEEKDLQDELFKAYDQVVEKDETEQENQYDDED